MAWRYDFYDHLWRENLKKDFYLIFTVLECVIDPSQAMDTDYVVIGYAAHKMNKPDGQVNYGTFDLMLYEPPAKIRNHDADKLTGAEIKFTIGHYVPQKRHVPPPQRQPVPKPVPPKKQPTPKP